MILVQFTGLPCTGKTAAAHATVQYIKDNYSGARVAFIEEPAQRYINSTGSLDGVDPSRLLGDMVRDILDYQRNGIDIAVMDSHICLPRVYGFKARHDNEADDEQHYYKVCPTEMAMIQSELGINLTTNVICVHMETPGNYRELYTEKGRVHTVEEALEYSNAVFSTASGLAGYVGARAPISVGYSKGWNPGHNEELAEELAKALQCTL